MYRIPNFISLAALVAISLLFQNCKNKSNNQLAASDQVVTTGQIPKDFEDFYEKFHTDSAYQIAHITWPLQGTKGIQRDSTTTGVEDTYWKQEDWHLMRLDLIRSGEYLIEQNPIGDMMILERIRAKAVPFGIERRFAKQVNGEWELIFYSDVFEFK
jgi:hypothetical protein